VTKLIDDDNLMVPERFAAGRPYESWRTLRHNCPVYWSEPKGFRPYWSVTKHADILEVENRSDIFLNEPRFMIMDAGFESYINNNYGSINELLKLLVQMDAPEHTKHRTLLQPWFTPKRIAARQQEIEAICHSYFDRLSERGREGEVDFAQGIAFWFPLRVACSLLGTPEEDDVYIQKVSEELLSFQAPPPGEKSGFEKMLDYCEALANDRRQHPRDDLATYLVQAEIDGAALQPRELLAHFLIIATAGHDTAATSIMGGVKALVENSEQWQLLRDDLSLIAGAVEEILRWVSPNLQFARTAKEDYVLNGQRIRAGESLALIYPSANRDEDVFTDPDRFLVARSPNPHLAFGAGAHSCLGSQLGRLELRCFFKTFIERIEHLELDAPAELLPTNVVSRYARMPVRYRYYFS